MNQDQQLTLKVSLQESYESSHDVYNELTSLGNYLWTGLQPYEAREVERVFYERCERNDYLRRVASVIVDELD